MIWKWEGELYKVALPTIPVFEALEGLPDTKKFFCDGAVLWHDQKHYIIRERKAGEWVKTGVSWFIKNPEKGCLVWNNDIMPFHVMLIPLDENRQPMDWSLRNAYPEGSIVENGYLYRNGASVPWPYSGYLMEEYDQYSIGESSPEIQPMRWIFTQGCFVSTTQLFRAKPKTLWKRLYLE